MAAARRRLLPAVALLALAAGCSSPEAERVRGSGPGADVRNTGGVVRMHDGSDPFYATPCLGDAATCAEAPTMTASGAERVSRSGSQ